MNLVERLRDSTYLTFPSMALEAADRIEALEKQRDELRAEIWSMTSLGQRLALELQCVLLDCKDMAIVSKWDGPAHEALQAWEDFCRSVTHGDEK